MREGGGDCVKYMKGGETEKRGGDTKILKMGDGQVGSRGGHPKKRGA